MKHIGNIITKSKIEVSDYFCVTDSLENVNKNLPTLIVGWSFTKELFPEQDILSSKINDSITWTFSKREKRYRYEQDFDNFVNFCIQKMQHNVNYKFFNYLIASPEKRKSFLDFVNRGGCSIYYNSRFLYVYSPNSKMTIGISLSDLKYVGIKIKAFLSMLNIEGNNLITNKMDFLDKESFFLIKDNTKSLAYLNYLKN